MRVLEVIMPLYYLLVHTTIGVTLIVLKDDNMVGACIYGQIKLIITNYLKNK